MELIIDTRLRACVLLHDVLHGFFAGRVRGTVILDLKLVQEFNSVYQEPFSLVLLDLCKAYYMVDHGPLLAALEGYVDGPQICRLMAVF